MNGRWTLPSLLSPLDYYRGVDTTPDAEFSRQPHEPRLGGAGELVEDFVRHRFMKGAPVAERPDVELQGFELHAQTIGHVLEFERGEVGLPGLRTQARELRDRHANGVIARRRRINERFERVGRCGRHEVMCR